MLARRVFIRCVIAARCNSWSPEGQRCRWMSNVQENKLHAVDLGAAWSTDLGANLNVGAGVTGICSARLSNSSSAGLSTRWRCNDQTGLPGWSTVHKA